MTAAIRNPRAIVASVAIIGVAIRIAWQIQTGFYESPPVFEEDEIARNILAGRGHVWHFLGTDWTSHIGLFPSFIALLHWIDGGSDRYVLIGLMQAAISVVVVWSAYVVASLLWSRPAGVLAAVIVAFHPALVIMPARGVISAVYDQAIAAGVIVALLMLVRRPGLASGLWFGMAAAVAVLLRPSIALAAQVAVLPLARRAPFVLAIAAALFVVANMFMVVRTQLQQPEEATSALCLTLWLGNNPESSGGALNRHGRSQYDEMTPDLAARLVGKDAAEQGAVFCDVAFTWLASDPLGAVAWQLTKYWYFWWFPPMAGALYPPGWLDAYRIAYVIEVVVASLGVVTIWRRGWREGLQALLLFMALVAATQAIFYVEGRHRLLVEVGIASLASAGVVTPRRSCR